MKILKFLDSYADAFGTSHVNHLVEHYHIPLMIFHENETYALTSKDQILPLMEQVFSMYQEKGLCKADYELLSMMPLSEKVTIVSLRWDLKNERGEVFSSFLSYYQLMKHDETWQISVITNINESL